MTKKHIITIRVDEELYQKFEIAAQVVYKPVARWLMDLGIEEIKETAQTINNIDSK